MVEEELSFGSITIVSESLLHEDRKKVRRRKTTKWFIIPQTYIFQKKEDLKDN
jgi:hypothetical protein